MKTKYILHGGYAREDSPENIKFFSECFADTPEKSNVLIVLFASENDGDIEYYKNFCVRLKKFTDKELSFTKANREDFISQITQADIVFLQGGDTNRILEALQRYPALSETFSNKTIIGSSAGAYALANLGTSHEEVHMREGLSILPLRVVCHYQSEKLPPSETSLKEIRNSKKDLELVLLKDYEHKVFFI
jgi:peptidase E